MDAIEGLTLTDGAAFTEGLAEIFIVAQILSLLIVVVLLGSSQHAYLFGTVRRQRRFRCPLMARGVEVEFLERWLLGFRRSAAVQRCSAFEVPTAIECRRPCANSSFRRQWDFPLPIARRPES